LKGDDLSSLVTNVIDKLSSNSITTKKGGSTTIKGGMIIEGYAFYAGTGLGVGILNMLLTFLVFLAIIASAIAGVGTSILLYKAIEGLFQILVYKYMQFKTRFIKPTVQDKNIVEDKLLPQASKFDLVKDLGFDESRKEEIDKAVNYFNEHFGKHTRQGFIGEFDEYYPRFVDNHDVPYGKKLVESLREQAEIANRGRNSDVEPYSKIFDEIAQKIEDKIENPEWKHVPDVIPDGVAEQNTDVIDAMNEVLGSTNKGGAKTKKNNKMKRKGRKTNRKK
jgi:hypothetical protein